MSRFSALFFPLSAVLACDPAPGKVPTDAAPTSVQTVVEPARPQKPSIAVTLTGWTIGSERIEGANDAKGRMIAVLASNVVDQEVVADIARNVLVSAVPPLFAALMAAKAKSVRMRTPERDRSVAEIIFPLGAKRENCMGVGFIGKDLAINAWTAGGTTATRFSKGMAGPDLTLGSAGIRKVIDRCTTPVFAISGDEKISWGLVVDLVLAVTSDDAGAPKSPVLLLTPPVPGRKVDLE